MRKILTAVLSFAMTVCMIAAGVCAFAVAEAEELRTEQLALGEVCSVNGSAVEIYRTDAENQPLEGVDLGGGTYGLAATDHASVANDASKITVTTAEKVYAADYVRYIHSSDRDTLQIYFLSAQWNFADSKKGDVLLIASDFTLTTSSAVYTFGENGTKYTYDGSAWVKGELSEKEALVIGGLEYQENFLGAYHCTFAYFSEIIAASDWQDAMFDHAYFEYKNEAGEDKLTRVTNTSYYLCINFGGNPPAEGDTLTIKEGFSILGKELKQDVTFTYTGSVWSRQDNSSVPLAVGDVYGVPSGGGFYISLTDETQSLTTAGWIGSGDTFAFYDRDWGYNFISNIQDIYMVHGSDVYYPFSVRHFRSGSLVLLQLYFDKSTAGNACDFGAASKGDMLCFSKELRINTNEAVTYNFGENGTYYYYDGAAWKKVGLADDATIVNSAESLAAVAVGSTLQLEYGFEEGFAAPTPAFSSSDDTVAKVDSNGLIEGVKEGTAEITLAFSGFTKSVSVTVVPKLEIASLAVEISSAIMNDGGALVAYVQEDLSAERIAGLITAKFGYEDGTYGKPFAVAAENISLDSYDNTKEGESCVLVTVDGFTASLPVHVYKLISVNGPSASLVDFWSVLPFVYFSSLTADFNYVNVGVEGDALQALGLTRFVSMKSAQKNGAVDYPLSGINYLYSQQAAFAFEGKNKNNMETGDVLTVYKGFRIYKRDNGAYIALYELANDMKLVWTGSQWADFAAEAESVEPEETEISLAVGAYYRIPYTVSPAGSFIKARIISSDPESVAVSEDGTAITVLKAASSPVTVTIRLGDDKTTDKTISVTASELEIAGFEIYEAREYNLSLGEEFKLQYYYNAEIEPRKLYAVAVYSDGSTGAPFELNEENTSVSGYDKTKAGAQTVTLTVSRDGKRFDTEVAVKVKNSVAQVSDLLMEDAFGGSPLTFYISFAQTANNEVNIPVEISDAYEIASYVKLVRDGAEYPMNAQFNGQFLVLTAVFPESVAEADRVYKQGDKIILSKGLPVLQWMGNSKNYNMVGAGEYVVAGTVEYEIVYRRGADKGWDTLIDYVDIEIASDTVEIGFGKLKDLGAAMVPSYATVGEFTITSDNPAVASVNANGLVKGESIGTAHLTVVLDGGANGRIEKIITVNVTDVTVDIKFNVDKLYVPVGTVSLTAQKLRELGVEAVYVWASGKEEGAVDFSEAKFVGYSANAEGEQTITVRITQNGVTTTGKLIVIVGEAPKVSGCGSVISSAYGIAAAVLAVGFALGRKKRRR